MNRIMLVIVAGVSAGCFEPAVLAQSHGTFSATRDMTSARAGHTATLLPNGKVLIAGGLSSSGFDPAIATAELYDPSTGTFTRTGDMITARVNHSAILLPNGKVLIDGGFSSGTTETRLEAELYDPSTGTFSPAGSTINRPHVFGLSQPALLPDGRVLFAGSSIAEIYDPVKDSFAATASYTGTNPNFVAVATPLSDGTVLLTGGTKVAGWAELYDPSDGKFTIAGPPSEWDSVYRATLLTNGQVLVVGNYENDGFPADAELYEATTHKFHGIGQTSAGHEFGTALLLPDGTVFLAGGQEPGGDGERDTELYEPATGTFAAAGYMITARHYHTATLLPDGSVLIAGGYSAWPYPTSRVERYIPAVLQPGAALLSTSGDGHGQGAVLHAGTSQAATASAPAAIGEALEVYCTGLVDKSVIPPQVAIGGRTAEILFFGTAPGYKNLNQVNVRVPSGVAPGPAVPVRLTYLNRPSNEVTIGVK